MPRIDDKLKHSSQRAHADRQDPSPPAERPVGAPAVRLLFSPIDITFLVCFRIAFGALMLWLGWQYHQYGMIERYYIVPQFHLTYYGFGWVAPWPAVEALGLSRGDTMYLHFIILGILAGMLALGLFYRISALLFCLGFTYIFLLEKARYLNHYYLICLISFLMIFLPAHRAFSLDSWWRPALRSPTVPAWTLRILQFQIVVVYFFAGVTKCGSDWIQGEPMGTFLFNKQFMFPESLRELMLGPTTALLLAWSATLLDLVVFPLLLWKKTRWFALIAAVVFHLMNTQLFHIDIFPWFMLASSILFFFPDRLPLRNRDAAYFGTDRPLPAETGRLSPPQRWTAAALAAYAAVQLFVPLRPYVYSGNANWNYAGHAFAWRMLATSKQTDLDDPPQYFLRARKNGRTVEATIPLDAKHPEFDRVTWKRHWQFSNIAVKPDLILQHAHIQARSLRIDGYEDVEIRGWFPVSLNGRPPQPLIDPEVDLALEHRRWLTPYPWVLPLETPLPSFERRRRLQAAQLRKLQLWEDRIRTTLGFNAQPIEAEAVD